jgi:hypothetical protein
MRGTKMQSRDESSAFRVSRSIKKAAEKAATADGRSLSDFIRRALVRQLVELGYLPAAARGEQPGLPALLSAALIRRRVEPARGGSRPHD